MALPVVEFPQNDKNYHWEWLSRFANHVGWKVFKMRPEGLQKAFRMCSRVVQKCVKGVQHGSTCAQNRSAIPSGNFHFGTVPGTKIDHLGNTSFIGCPTVHIFRIMPEKNQHITFLWVKIEVVPQKLDETPNTPWISMGWSSILTQTSSYDPQHLRMLNLLQPLTNDGQNLLVYLSNLCGLLPSMGQLAMVRTIGQVNGDQAFPRTSIGAWQPNFDGPNRFHIFSHHIY